MDAETQITLRPFTPADMLGVAEIERAVFDSAGYHPLFIRQFYDLFPSLIWVAWDAEEKRVAGHIFGGIAQGGEVGWILNFAVLARYRRMGLGRRLLERLVAELLATGVARVRITAEVENAGAIRLYERVGFRRIGVGENYYGDGADRAIFEYQPEGS